MTEIPDKNGYVPPGICYALYKFYPSFAAAILFSILFGAVTALHISQAVKYKTTFCWLLIMACCWEFFSFVTHAASTKYQQNAGLALVTQILVLMAPLWINAFDYMVLGRMIHFFSPSHSIFGILGSLLELIFVILDVVSFIIQLIGGSLAGPTAPDSEIRIFFRLIEFSAGKDAAKNPLPFHEVYFYVFEAVPMLFALAALNVVHPGSVLVGPDAEMPGLKNVLCGRRRKQYVEMEWNTMEV
ncbi:hypothetical protein C8R44DRAFT_879994 [Mycena epipterygia]|nr:hypothetical protein C8R44DRAFT_879994 [Mycena epipterygia]